MRFNPDVRDCAAAPIAEAWSWVDDASSLKLIDACQAVPPDLPSQALRDHVGKAIISGEAASYTDIAGLAALRKTFAHDINDRYAGDVNATDVVITAGCNQAFCSTIDALCEKGDDVIVPLPCYFNHEMWLSIRGITAKFTSFHSQSTEPDVDEARALISGRTRAIVLVTPNNPTGAIYTPQCIERFHRLAREFDLALIVDETYRDFMDEGEAPHALFTDPEWREQFVHLYSFSKAYSLTGHRVGAVVCGPALRDSIMKIQDCTAICASHAGQLAALYGLQNLRNWKREKCAELVQRARAVSAAFGDSRLDYKLLSAGAYFAYVKHPFRDPARDVAMRLVRDFGIVCLPGSYFGEGQEHYLRFAFSNLNETQLPELIERLVQSQQ